MYIYHTIGTGTNWTKRGLRILGFPCNQFNGQEPGSGEEIECFLLSNKTEFGDIFTKADVNGSDALPLWKYLKHKQAGTFGDFIKWNYTKFIVDREGQPRERHGPNVDPSALAVHIEKYI